jgi:hypothetical protein
MYNIAIQFSLRKVINMGIGLRNKVPNQIQLWGNFN